ncbi:MAG: sigma-54 dependent transcriptional regulator [Xanthomonadales bacterium]|nr:sigma-54 dependent transcriptional regulator [Xanthomonadales bacterium]
MHTILIIDDNPAVFTALDVLFSLHDYSTVYAESPEQGLSMVQENSGIDLVIQDMNFSADTTSGEEGVALFHAIRQHNPHLPVILLTAWSHLEQAVALVKDGAADYLSKPWDDDKLVITVKNLLQLGALSRHQQHQISAGQRRRDELAQEFNLAGLIYESEDMHTLVATAVRVAKADVPVLITGPNGCGKEKIAELIQANSQRQQKPFVRVNMGALPADLLEAELFGVEAGAYTGAQKARPGRFEAAHGGTLFLDEIGNLPLSGQVKLLRVLQTGEYQRLGSHEPLHADVRIVSATNSDLNAAIAAGDFREDLLYRLNVIELRIPALGERPDDILPLARRFLESPYELSPEAEQRLRDHPWPGNVRELENCMQRAMLLCAKHQIQVNDLGLPALKTPSTTVTKATSAHAVINNATAPTSNQRDEPNEQQIRQALDQAGGVVSAAARELGMSRQSLYRRLEKFGIKGA